jgi:hypothetical protein
MYDALDALKVLAKHHRLIDRVAEDDWRKQFEEAGIDPEDFREYMIQRATERLEAGNK